MKIIKIAFVLAALTYLTGCASGAKMENMAYTGDLKVYDSSLENNLGVTAVTGGEETNPAWTSEISDDAFSGAVKQSLESQGLLSENGRYQLDVTMLEVDQPMFGLDFEVITHVKYVLMDSETENVVLDETVIAPHTATVSDAFMAIERLRIANEGSGRKNIEGLLNKLSELKIGSGDISLAP